MNNHQNSRKKIILLFLLILGISVNVISQEVLTLEEALTAAIKNSPEIMKSELNMVISQENLKARNAATKSNFSFQITPFSYSQSKRYETTVSKWITSEIIGAGGSFIVRQPIVRTDGVLTLENGFNYTEYNSEEKSYSNNLLLSYLQPLFSYNKQKMEIEQLRRALENATLSYSMQRMYLEQMVSRYFYNVHQIQMSLKVSEDELANQKVSYEIIKSKVEAGLSAREQFLQAELNLAQSEANLKNKQVELENAKDQFRQYLGMPMSEEFNISVNIEYNPVVINYEKAIQSGLETRMELRQREINIQNSNDNLTIAKSFNKFNGNANIRFGYFGQDSQIPHIYDKPTRSPEIAFTFSIPIWDWGERKSRIKAAESEIKIQEIELQDQRTAIELSIRQSFRSLQNLVLQIEIAKQNEKNAQLTYDINLERYRNGDLTSMDLSLFQNQLSNAKLNQVNSLVSYKLEILNMKIQSLWDFETNSSFVPKEIKDNIESVKMK